MLGVRVVYDSIRVAMNDLQPSDPQRRIIASALTLLAALFILGVLACAAWWLGRFLIYFSNVFMPIAVAGIVALVIKPYYRRIFAHTGRRAWLAVVLVYLSLLIPLAVVLWFFGALIAEQAAGLVRSGAHLVREGWLWLIGQWPHIVEMASDDDWNARVQEVVEQRFDVISGGVVAALQAAYAAGANVFRLLAGLFSWFIFPIYLAFFLASETPKREKVEGGLPFLKTDTRSAVVYLGAEFVNILVSFFRGQLIIALLQGLLYGAGFSLIGLQYGFVLGLTLGFMNIVPYLGSIIGLAVAIPLALFQTEGGLALALLVVAVFTVVQLIESYVLTPRIMGGRTGLHPVVIIIAIFFWGTAFGGIWGMILAIPLTAFLVVLWRFLRDRYIREVV